MENARSSSTNVRTKLSEQAGRCDVGATCGPTSFARAATRKID